MCKVRLYDLTLIFLSEWEDDDRKFQWLLFLCESNPRNLVGGGGGGEARERESEEMKVEFPFLLIYAKGLGQAHS